MKFFQGRLTNAQTKKKLTIESIPGKEGYESYNGNNVRIDFDVDQPDVVLKVPEKSDFLNDIGGPTAAGGARQRVPAETIPLGSQNPVATKLDDVSIPSNISDNVTIDRSNKDKMTTLYRVVDPDELSDIKHTGELINRGSAEGKYFTTSSEHASDYAKKAVNAFNDPPYTTIKTQVPSSLLPEAVNVDGGIPAYVVPNQSLTELKPEVLKSMALPK